MPRGEKRQNQRHAISRQVRWAEISPVGTPGETARTIRGELQDISSGGVCLLTSHPLEESCLVRGSIPLAEVPVSLPSLMRVCWVQRVPKGARYRVGLQFLL